MIEIVNLGALHLQTVETPAGLYVPVAPLVRDELGMTWAAEAKWVAVIADRWDAKWIDIRDGSLASKRQLCIPIGWLEVFLWMLRPRRIETQEKLDSARWAARQFLGERRSILQTTPPPESAEDLREQLHRARSAAAQALATQRWQGKKRQDRLIRIAANPGDYREEDWFKFLRLLAKKETRRSIGHRLGVTGSAVSMVLAGNYPANITNIRKLAIERIVPLFNEPE